VGSASARCKYHNRFRVLEVEDQRPLHEDLEIHLIQLPRLRHGARGQLPEPSAVVRWGKFLAARNPEELEQLAMSDPNLREAKDALERLSADPAAQELAEERRYWAWNYENDRRLTRQEGREEGRAEGLAAGLEALREVLFMTLDARGLQLSPLQRERVTSCDDFEQLKQWQQRALRVDSATELFA
jgi:predicted transposase/invertase (TIGR01784 family)